MNPHDRRRHVPLTLNLLTLCALAGCAATTPHGDQTRAQINDTLLKASMERRAPSTEAAEKSLMPPLLGNAAGAPLAPAEADW